MNLKSVSRKILPMFMLAMFLSCFFVSDVFAAKEDLSVSMDFNGESDGINLGTSYSTKMTGDFTIEMDIKPGSSQKTYADILDINHRDNIGLVIQQNVDDLNNYGFYIGNGSTSAGITYRLQTDAWQHVVFMRAGTELKLYVNQVLVAVQPCFSGNINYLANSNVTVGYNLNYGRYFNGSIKNLSLYGYAKTQPALLSFNGSSDGTNLGSSLSSKLTGDFSIEMDVLPGNSQQTYADIIDFNHRDNIGMVFQQNVDDVNNFGFYIGNGSTSAGIEYRLQAGVWQHVVFQRNQTELRLYINDVLVAVRPCFSGSISYLPDSNVTVGYNVNYGRYFNGSLQNLQIYDYAKEQSAVINLNGSTDGIRLGTSLPAKMTGNFSIEMEVNPNATQQTYADILDFNHRTNVGLVIQQNGDQLNNFGFGIGNGSTSSILNYQLTAGVWQNVKFQRLGTELRLYVNGKLVGKTSCFAGSISYLPDSGVTVGYNVNYGRYFNGMIKNLKILPLN